MKRVLVAMSGGVDSSVAAWLLRQEGWDVVGCTMQLWDARRNPSDASDRPSRGGCCSPDDVFDARRVAERLGVPFFVVNLEADFERHVVAPFIEGYLLGSTPIPCARCNTFLKFGGLLRFARGLGIEYVATGHYARIESAGQDGFRLLRGVDERKDQSYFLFELRQAQLARVVFPLGGYRKTDTRRLAREADLPTAVKRESREICFLPDGDLAGFIRRETGRVRSDLLPVLENRDRPGAIELADGSRLGTHGGVFRYTVGQRKGLGVAYREPLYVTKIDPERNRLVVGPRSELLSLGLVTAASHWIRRPQVDLQEPMRVEVKIRSTHRPVSAVVVQEGEPEGPTVVLFDEPQAAITPGQAAVFYRGSEVLGGGWIQRPLSNEEALIRRREAGFSTMRSH
ncbi:MAG TPA: tRNA 2-thiouridine(34) synthase MnmA [Acidobacteriota bacterium]|jgi:tRNA-specific 2-thiouridylase|nr:tRNA 2-thiouridine(34) synthase MnmA [Acidobacteriota bacterium]